MDFVKQYLFCFNLQTVSRFLILINQDHYYPPAVIIRKNNTYGISELSITSETPPTVVNNVSLKLMTAFFCSITADS